jgi:hypothetical protein
VYIIKRAQKKQVLFSIPLAVILVMFIYVDRPTYGKNLCEREGLVMLSEAKTAEIKLSCDCTVLSWFNLSKKESELNVKLLKHWNVTDSVQRYYCDDI